MWIERSLSPLFFFIIIKGNSPRKPKVVHELLPGKESRERISVGPQNIRREKDNWALM